MKRKKIMKQTGYLVFAKGVIYLVGLAALSVCFILLPELAREESVGKSDITVPFLSIAYILATPFFIALYQAHKLLQYIAENKAFSHQSINALQNIKICAVVFSFLMTVLLISGVIFLRTVAPQEDAPPFVLFGSILIFISSVFAVFVALLQKLLSDAVALKSENDLII